DSVWATAWRGGEADSSESASSPQTIAATTPMRTSAQAAAKTIFRPRCGARFAAALGTGTAHANNAPHRGQRKARCGSMRDTRLVCLQEGHWMATMLTVSERLFSDSQARKRVFELAG